jgi:hypothetical protein
VRQRYPELSGLLTDHAAENTPMRAISTRLGFEQTRLARIYQKTLGNQP